MKENEKKKNEKETSKSLKNEKAKHKLIYGITGPPKLSLKTIWII